jgi:hypothetical protein
MLNASYRIQEQRQVGIFSLQRKDECGHCHTTQGYSTVCLMDQNGLSDSIPERGTDCEGAEFDVPDKPQCLMR